MNLSPAGWSLHPQLERDTTLVSDLPLSRLLAMRDANYPWLILVPRRANVVELIDLDDTGRNQLTDEIAHTSRALKEATQCDKLNVAALGNVVLQLHVHVIARRHADAAWPKPVWGVVPALPYDAVTLTSFVNSIRDRL